MGFLDNAGLSHLWGKVKAALTAHENDRVKHVTSLERSNWGGKADTSLYNVTDARFKEKCKKIGVNPCGSGFLWNRVNTSARTLAYGDGVFVAMSSANSAIYSKDYGVTWQKSYLPISAYWKCMAYGNGVFVAVATNDNAAVYSTDYGETWNKSALPASAEWISIAYGYNMFVVVATDSDKSAYSTDGGVTWKESTLPSNTSWQDIDYIGEGHGEGAFSRFVVVTNTYGVYPASSNPLAYEESDVLTWGILSDTMQANAISCGLNHFAIAGFDTIYYASADGNGNVIAADCIPASFSHITYCDGMFIAISTFGQAVCSTDDGLTWTEISQGLTGSAYDIACGGGRAVIGYSDSLQYADTDVKAMMAGLPITAPMVDAAKKSVSATATLTAAGWQGNQAPYTQVISVPGLTADGNGTIGLAHTATAAQREAARNALIEVTGQGIGTITVTADGDKPVTDIPINVIIFG